MRLMLKVPLALALSLSFASAQQVDPNKDTSESSAQAEASQSLNDDDRLSVLAAALDRKVRRAAEPDCSHLVHAIYEHAGFPYAYAPSKDLYAGVDGFERVKQPQPGDLIVWRGHVGIVIKPSTHIFFSFMSSGPGTDDYEAAYWKHRGKPRFYRYVKNSCEECDESKKQSHRLLTIRRSKER
jgi:NlpC/P60 family